MFNTLTRSVPYGSYMLNFQFTPFAIFAIKQFFFLNCKVKYRHLSNV